MQHARRASNSNEVELTSRRQNAFIKYMLDAICDDGSSKSGSNSDSNYYLTVNGMSADKEQPSTSRLSNNCWTSEQPWKHSPLPQFSCTYNDKVSSTRTAGFISILGTMHCVQQNWQDLSKKKMAIGGSWLVHRSYGKHEITGSSSFVNKVLTMHDNNH